MENKNEEKLSTGLKVVSIIELVMSAFAIFGLLVNLVMGDKINSILQVQGIEAVSKGELVIPMIIILCTVLGIILMLCKKQIGVYIYFITYLTDIISSIIMNGFKIGNFISSLIWPLLMLYFVNKNKHILMKSEEKISQ